MKPLVGAVGRCSGDEQAVCPGRRGRRVVGPLIGRLVTVFWGVWGNVGSEPLEPKGPFTKWRLLVEAL